MQRERAKKQFEERWQFSAVAAVPPKFRHNPTLFFIKATAMPNIMAVTLFFWPSYPLIKPGFKSRLTHPLPMKKTLWCE